jgi:hypothetical protein
MKHFLEQLFTTGEVTVVPSGAAFEMSSEVNLEILRFDRSARLEMAGEAPELDLSVARWAAQLLAESARLTVARDLGPQHVARIFARGCSEPRSAEVDYSADLFLRYLPDLIRLVERLAAEDPLATRLRKLAEEWPLSSVGVAGLSVAAIEPFIEQPGLRQLYVDRILATGDLSRLSDPRVALAARAALGAHPELAPAVAKAIGTVAGTRDWGSFEERSTKLENVKKVISNQ